MSEMKLCFFGQFTMECMRWREGRVVVLIQMMIVEQYAIYMKNEDETEKEVTNEVVVVDETPLLDTSCNPFNSVFAP